MTYSGKLLRHEIHLKEDEEEVSTKKGMALKPINEDFYSTTSNEESTTMIFHRLNKMLKSKLFNPKDFTRDQRGMKDLEKVKIFQIIMNLIWVLLLVVDCKGMVVKDWLILQRKG